MSNDQLPDIELDWDPKGDVALHTAVRDYLRRIHDLTDTGKIVEGFATTGRAKLPVNDDGSMQVSVDQFQFLLHELHALRSIAFQLAILYDPRP
ncbi:MAG: hypothetical protein ACLQAN_06720 [Acidimicrobiales bacterium]